MASTGSMREGRGPAGEASKGTRLRIGIIGVGEEGGTLVRKLAKHGHEIRMAHSKEPEAMKRLANETGAKPVEIVDIVKDVDVIFLSIPEKAIQELPHGLFKDCPQDLIVVDCCNYYPSRDGKIEELEDGLPESIWVKNQIGRDVVKAFNSILAGALANAGRPKGSEDRIALPISGDDPKAKVKIAKLIDELGFDPYDAGDLGVSWRQQPGSPAYCTNLDLKHLPVGLNAARKDVMPQLRDEAYRKMTSTETEMDWKSLVKMLRETYADSSKQIGLEELTGRSAATTTPT
jgi:predicted dinucleotide-binding enzyme